MPKPEFDPSKPFESPAAKPEFDPSKPFQILDDVTEKAPEMLETGARSALEGITGGLSEPVISGINAVVGNMIEAGFDAESIGEFAKQAVSSEAIKKQYEKDIARRRGLEAEFPEVAIPAEVGGAVLGGLAVGGLGAAGRLGTAGKALTAAPRAAEALAAGAAKAVPQIAGAIPQAAVRGAVAAGSAEALKAAAQVPTGVMAPEEMAIGEAALLGGKLGAGAETIVQGIKASPELAKKALSALGGVREEAISKYLLDPETVARAKAPDELKAIVDQHVDELNRQVEEGRLSSVIAKDAIKDAKQKLQQGIADQKAAIQSAMTGGKQLLVDDAVSAVDDLKKKVSQGSAASYDVLIKSKRSVDVAPALAAAESSLEDLKIAGKEPTTGAAAVAYNKIQKYVDDLKRFDKPLSAQEAKKKIQQLDKDVQYLYNAGEFDTVEEQAIKGIRRAFDEQLKDIPEYAAAMQVVRADTELLKDSAKMFGNPERARARIASIDRPDRDLERQTLSKLGLATGRPFEQELARFGQAGAALGTVEARAMAGAPGMALSQAEQAALVSQQRVASIQNTIKELGPFARPATNINAIGAAVADKNPEFTKYLQNLTQLSGQDFSRYIDDLRVAEAFNKEFRIGSRNVNLWALGAGAGVYAMTGDPSSALVIAGLGGGFGSMIDRFGPRMTQKVLDAYLKVEGLPTVQKIDRAFAGLPPEIVSSVKNDLVRGITVASSEPITVAPSQVEAVRADIMESDLPTTKKAKLVSDISRGKSIPSQDLGAVMIGKKARGPLYVPEKKPQDLKMDRPDVLKALQGLKE